jgi:hypothetical protein
MRCDAHSPLFQTRAKAGGREQNVARTVLVTLVKHISLIGWCDKTAGTAVAKRFRQPGITETTGLEWTAGGAV